MTSCANVRENISAYVDDELDVSERMSFEEHIDSCPACKEELEDMLRIIRICNDMPVQELPADFKAELHEKLTAVSVRQNVIHVVPKKPKKILIMRTFASIAAGILLIFLGGSIVRFGLFSEGFMAKSSQSPPLASPGAGDYNASAQADNSDSASYTMSAAADTADSRIAEYEAGSADESMIMDYGIMQSDDQMGALSKGFDVNRSEAMQARDDGIYSIMNMEMASSNSSTVTITAKDTAAALGKVTVLASVNNGILPAGSSGHKAANSNSDVYEAPARQDEAGARIQLDYIFSQADYSTFTAALNDTFGAADVQMGAFVSEDMTDTLNTLIDQSVRYDNRIQELTSGDAEKNAKEINKLKDEKESTDQQIEELRLNSDFVLVTVYINIK